MTTAGEGRLHPVPQVLVVGSRGRLAQAIKRQGDLLGLHPIFVGRPTFDLLQGGDLERKLERYSGHVVINTSAYTDVDGAETDAEAAFALNRDAPARLAKACATLDLPLIHVSTDYVFGHGETPRSEGDPVAPLGVYGLSKRAGEEALLAHHPCARVVRTSWLFDGHSPNFLTLMLGLRARPELSIIADQLGSPTLTDHLAQGLLELASRGQDDLPRLLHFANQGGCSRFEMAQEVFAKLDDGGPVPVLQPILASQWPAAAQRPNDSRLSVKGWLDAGLTPPATWQEAVAEGVEQWRTIQRTIQGAGV